MSASPSFSEYGFSQGQGHNEVKGSKNPLIPLLCRLRLTRIIRKLYPDASYDDWYYWKTIEDAAKHVFGIVGHEVEPTVEAIDEALENYMEEHEDEDIFYSFHEFKTLES